MTIRLVLTATATLFLSGSGLPRSFQDPLETLREQVQATPTFQGLARYPQEIRYAILAISQDPQLLLRLNYLPEDATESREKLLAAAPDDIAEAARLLLEEPEVLDILSHHLELTTMVGVVYKENKETLRAVTDESHERILQRDEEAVEAWAQQLQDNPEAASEFFEAEEDYEDDDDLTEEEEYTEEPDYGYDEDDEEYAFYALPPYGYTRYALRHAHRYPHLADCMVRQWRRGGNIGTFQEAGDGWWDRHRDLVDDDFLKDDGQRMERLKENALFDEKLRQDLGRRADDPTARRNYLAQHGDRYPSLEKHLRPMKISPKKKPARKSPAEAKKKRARKEPKKVSKKKPTKKQQTRKANKNMRRSYGGSKKQRPQRRGGRRR